MKRVISVLILCILVLGLMAGCGSKPVVGFEYGVTGYEYGFRGVTGHEYGLRGGPSG